MGMDGSDLRPVVHNVEVHALAVDQDSGSLYWIQDQRDSHGGGKSNLKEIVYMDPNGRNEQSVVAIQSLRVWGLSVDKDLVYWWDTLRNNSRIRLFKCNKKSANDLSLREIEIGPLPKGHLDPPFLLPLYSHQHKPVGPCTGQLCSHICALTPSGYMRCLCPAGFSLMPNGWSCGK